MKDYETLVRDIIQEENELKDRIIKLEYFMMTEDFQNIAIVQKALLRKQLSAMTEYKSILIDRVIRIRHEHEENKGKECEPEPEEKVESLVPHIFAAMEYEAHRQKTKIPKRARIIDCSKCKHYKQGSCTHRVLSGDESCWEAKE